MNIFILNTVCALSLSLSLSLSHMNWRFTDSVYTPTSTVYALAKRQNKIKGYHLLMLNEILNIAKNKNS